MTPSEAVQCARIAYLNNGEAQAAKLGFSYQSIGNDKTRCWIGRRGEKSVVAVRGSVFSEKKGFQIEASLMTDQVPWLGAGRVHEGYYKGLWNILTELKDILGNSQDVYFTGHSMGAAIALLAAVTIGARRVFCFASPKVGDEGFAEAAGAFRITRFENRCDLFTKYPFRGSVKGDGENLKAPYVHAGRGVRLSTFGHSIQSYVEGVEARRTGQ